MRVKTAEKVFKVRGQRSEVRGQGHMCTCVSDCNIRGIIRFDGRRRSAHLLSLSVLVVMVLPSPPIDNIRVMVIVWRLRRNIIRTAGGIQALSTYRVIDRELSLAAHVTAVCRSGYNQLRQLRSVVRSLSVNATKTLDQAFISCRLDYCNSLLYGVSDGLLQRLQSVQNAAARLVTGACRSDHITPVLRQLH